MDLDLRKFLVELPELWKQQDLQGGLTDPQGDRTARKAFGIGELGLGGTELVMGGSDAGVELFAFRGLTPNSCSRFRIEREIFGSLLSRMFAAFVKL